ncbi:MAG: sugar porter family MFS transporter [Actinobacteria bacterium]|nr:sugar porter family MFS transporter [Actinomycetota bacterium]
MTVFRSAPRYTYLVASVAALGGLLFGYDIGVISGAELQLVKAFHMSSGSEELAVAAVLIGSVLGAVFAGKLADRISRRYALLVMAIVYGLGAVLTAISPGYWWFFAFRLVTGVAVGASSMIVPVFIAELAPRQVRGALVILQQLAIAFGILVSYLFDFLYTKLGWGWRPMFATAVVAAVALAVGMLRLDHSPRWLAMRGRWDEARAVTAKVDPGASDDEIDAIRDSIEAEQTSSWRDLLRPGLRGALVAGVGLAVFQQFIGPNTVLFYGPTIFSYVGGSSASSALVSTIYVGLTLFLFVFAAIALVDLIGRKALFYIGLSGMTAMLVALGFIFRAGATHYGVLLLVALIIYIACYSASISPLFWLMSAEVFPTRLRGVGASWASVANWSANLLVTVTYLTMIADIGKSWTFWTYAIVGVLALIFVRFFVPETKARPLEDIEDYWVGGQRWPEHSGAGSR